MQDRYLILAEGKLGIFDAKTANGIMRYRPESVVGVVDSTKAGQNTKDVLNTPTAIPILASVEEGFMLKPSALVIGISPAGGALPDAWRRPILQCLERGIDVVSGLHFFLADDAEFSALASVHNAQLVDVRHPPERQPIGKARAKNSHAKRVLAVGTDANVGKMTAALELWKATNERGLDARFLATGQTGIMIAGNGVPLDRVAADFMTGLLEEMVIENGASDWLFIEGQGSLLHPAYSCETLALIHGTLPDYMVLCMHAGRSIMRAQDEPIPPLSVWIRLYEAIAEPLHPSKVIGIAVNCHGLDENAADAAVARVADETGLPTTDVVRCGVTPLLEALQIPL